MSALPCARITPLLDTYVDGELPTELTLTVQQHLSECTICSHGVQAARQLKDSLRVAVREDAPVSPAFMAQVEAALAEENQREQAAERLSHMNAQHGLLQHGPLQHGPLPWRAIAPLVAAAAAVLLWAGTRREATQPTTSKATNKVSVAESAPLEEMLDKLIDYHSTPPPQQVTEANLVPDLERDVGVRVHLPNFDGAQFARNAQARWPGPPQWQSATVVPVRNQRAAYLRYTVAGHRVTLYVYNSGRVPVHQKLEQRLIHNLPVYVGERRGYSIAARERKGIGYAVATDFNDMESAELVAAIH